MGERHLVVHGARGSMSVSGDAYRRYGGNTTCFAVEVAPKHYLVIDCGTGLRNLEHLLDLSSPHTFSVFLTHFHWDHIQGLPVFSPLYDEMHRFVFHAVVSHGVGVGELLGRGLRPPLFPVALDEAPAAVSYHSLEGPVNIAGVMVTPAALRHPQGVTAYRLDSDVRSVVIATDHEAGDPDVDARLTDLASGADVLLHDGQYTEEELTAKAGWGHSSWAKAVDAAKAAGVARLVLTSHDPDRSDDGVDHLVQTARRRFALTYAAYEGLVVRL